MLFLALSSVGYHWTWARGAVHPVGGREDSWHHQWLGQWQPQSWASVCRCSWMVLQAPSKPTLEYFWTNKTWSCCQPQHTILPTHNILLLNCDMLCYEMIPVQWWSVFGVDITLPGVWGWPMQYDHHSSKGTPVWWWHQLLTTLLSAVSSQTWPLDRKHNTIWVDRQLRMLRY